MPAPLPPTRAAGDGPPYDDINLLSTAVAELQGGSAGSTVADRRWTAAGSHAQNREFRDDADLTGAVRVDNAGGSGRASWSRVGDSLVVVCDGRTTQDAAGEMHGYVWPYALAVGEAVQTCVRWTGPQSSFPWAGLVVADGTTYGSGNQVLWSIWHASDARSSYQDGLWTGWNNRASFTDRSTVDTYLHGDIHMRLLRDTSDVWRYQVSSDTVYWHEISSRTLAMTPSHIGFAAGMWGYSGQHSWSWDYLRVT